MQRRDNILAIRERERPAITEADELRIRRAIRFVVEYSRQDVDGLSQYVFDLVNFLPPHVQVIVEDEVACTFAHLIGTT
jgi:hypothetical protein